MTEPAGLLRRLAAIVYDLFVLAALLIGATAALLPFTGAAIAPGTGWYQLLLGAIVLAYFAGFWWRRGQTVGMVAWQLHLVTATGERPSLGRTVARALLAPLSLAAAGLGYLWVLIDRERRAWHDLATGTRLQRRLLADSRERENHRGAEDDRR